MHTRNVFLLFTIPPHLFLLGLAFESTLARLSSLLGERVRLNVRFFPFLKWKKTVKRQRTPVTTNQACLSARVPPPSGLNLYFFPVFLLIPLSVLDANSVLFFMVFPSFLVSLVIYIFAPKQGPEGALSFCWWKTMKPWFYHQKSNCARRLSSVTKWLSHKHNIGSNRRHFLRFFSWRN